MGVLCIKNNENSDKNLEKSIIHDEDCREIKLKNVCLKKGCKWDNECRNIILINKCKDYILDECTRSPGCFWNTKNLSCENKTSGTFLKNYCSNLTQCDSSPYCFKDENNKCTPTHIDDKINKCVSGYELFSYETLWNDEIYSKKCRDYNREPILSKNICQKIAKHLKLEFEEKSLSTEPLGCYHNRIDDKIIFNSSGTANCSEKKTCLCKDKNDSFDNLFVSSKLYQNKIYSHDENNS